MEPVGLALGIIPLVGGSLKVYKSTYSQLKTFRHYSREVDRVRKSFDRQRHFFLNEVHLVLRLVLEDESLVRDMIDDGAHKKWKSSSLEDSMADRLGTNAQSLKEIIEDIGTLVSDVEKGLECFSGLDKERLENERLKDTVRRVRDRMNIVFDKSKFEKWTSDLRDSNSDLKLFREQMGELCKPITRRTPQWKHYGTTQRLHKYTFENYTDTRVASQALHEALCTAWSTPDSEHFRHSVRLFLETKSRDEVQLDLIISCLEHKMKQAQSQTASYNARLASSLALANMMTVYVKSKALVILGPGFITTSLDSNNTRQKRRRVVRFEDDSDKECEI